MKEQRPLTLSLLIGKVHVIEPPGRCYGRQFGFGLLLPVEPPEVDALLLQRMMDDVQIISGKALVGNIEGNVLLGGRINAHRLCHLRVAVLPRLNARGRVQVQAGLQPVGVQRDQELVGVREEQPVPAIAGPAL